ncbi:MAG: hypothetical protein WBL05_05530 [Brooklawnia sp.]|uniref:hypothetical protein n=1 Tax=Brooklawnia sp. TaxID=2699740 RepID=UPI003C713004
MTKRGSSAYGRPIDRQTTNAFGRVVETPRNEEDQLKQRFAEVYAKHMRNRCPNHEAYLAAMRGSVDYYTKLTETSTDAVVTGQTRIHEHREGNK